MIHSAQNTQPLLLVLALPPTLPPSHPGGDFPLGPSPTVWVLIPGGSALFPTPTSGGWGGGSEPGEGRHRSDRRQHRSPGRVWGKKAGAEERSLRPPQLSPYSAPPLTALSAAGAREGTLRAGPKGSTWLGRAGKRRVGSSAGGQGRKRGRSLGVRPSLSPYHAAAPSPRPAAGLRGGGRGSAASPAAPAAASCAPPACGARPRLAHPLRRAVGPQPRPRPRPCEAPRGAGETAGLESPFRPSSTAGSAWFGLALALPTSGPELLPGASAPTAPR